MKVVQTFFEASRNASRCQTGCWLSQLHAMECTVESFVTLVEVCVKESPDHTTSPHGAMPNGEGRCQRVGGAVRRRLELVDFGGRTSHRELCC